MKWRNRQGKDPADRNLTKNQQKGMGKLGQYNTALVLHVNRPDAEGY